MPTRDSGRFRAAASRTARPRSRPRSGRLRKRWDSASTGADLLGRLDDYPTRSGYVISPFVFWAGDADPVANPDEVASIHRVALRELTRDDSPRFVSIPESDRPVIQLPIGDDLIHAPTGAVLYQFRAVAHDGEEVRVADLEEPVFAWR